MLGLAAVFPLGWASVSIGTLAFGCFFVAALFHELWAAGGCAARKPGLS